MTEHVTGVLGFSLRTSYLAVQSAAEETQDAPNIVGQQRQTDTVLA